jgi:hypothetical protein
LKKIIKLIAPLLLSLPLLTHAANTDPHNLPGLIKPASQDTLAPSIEPLTPTLWAKMEELITLKDTNKPENLLS